jgi:hypothetical protein
VLADGQVDVANGQVASGDYYAGLVVTTAVVSANKEAVYYLTSTL